MMPESNLDDAARNVLMGDFRALETEWEETRVAGEPRASRDHRLGLRVLAAVVMTLIGSSAVFAMVYQGARTHLAASLREEARQEVVVLQMRLDALRHDRNLVLLQTMEEAAIELESGQIRRPTLALWHVAQIMNDLGDDDDEAVRQSFIKVVELWKITLEDSAHDGR
jgi:hypothetical protein